MSVLENPLNYPLNFATQWEWINEELKNFKGNIVAAQITITSGETLRVVSVYSPA
jgi:hypothetical protein